MIGVGEMLRELIKEMIAVMRLVRALLWAITVVPSFGPRRQVKEEWNEMGQLFTYEQDLLPVKEGVDSQRLVVTVDGVDQEPIILPKDATMATFKAGPDGATVKLSLDYLDARGNDSGNAETEFVIVDKQPPAAPDGFGEIRQTAEENV